MNLKAPDAAIDTDLFGNALSELAIKRATGIQTFVDRGARRTSSRHNAAPRQAMSIFKNR
ncbi:MAG: hypothetical protein PHI64_08175 [Zoogloea sp.]|uniref:hypothetical protein n=1 Tax=Zoogloea sp. TaxID=49181 RepID=UPI00263449AD|nr:hypothetical protein [Zoogloea sp.]MDD2988923.1 hypothetical protein [Zoogloea sp.]